MIVEEDGEDAEVEEESPRSPEEGGTTAAWTVTVRCSVAWAVSRCFNNPAGGKDEEADDEDDDEDEDEDEDEEDRCCCCCCCCCSSRSWRSSGERSRGTPALRLQVTVQPECQAMPPSDEGASKTRLSVSGRWKQPGSSTLPSDPIRLEFVGDWFVRRRPAGERERR